MNYVTALSYRSAERVGNPFEKNGKLYTKIQEKCPRCNGLGIIIARIENGQPIPIPVDQGICYKCAGNKYLTKEVRLYEEEEYNKIQERVKKQKEHKEQERKEEQAKNFAINKENWLKKNGFSAEGYTYIYFKESYSIKEQLKEAGFRFDLVRLWHRNSPEGYENDVIKIFVDDIVEFAANGNDYYKTEAKNFIEKKIAEAQGNDSSDWVGEIGTQVSASSVTLVKKTKFSGYYGLTNVYTFKDQNDNLYTWFSTVALELNPGDICDIKGKVKKHDEYKGVKTTVLTRCKVTKVE